MSWSLELTLVHPRTREDKFKRKSHPKPLQSLAISHYLLSLWLCPMVLLCYVPLNFPLNHFTAFSNFTVIYNFPGTFSACFPCWGRSSIVPLLFDFAFVWSLLFFWSYCLLFFLPLLCWVRGVECGWVWASFSFYPRTVNCTCSFFIVGGGCSQGSKWL